MNEFITVLTSEEVDQIAQEKNLSNREQLMIDTIRALADGQSIDDLVRTAALECPKNRQISISIGSREIDMVALVRTEDGYWTTVTQRRMAEPIESALKRMTDPAQDEVSIR